LLELILTFSHVLPDITGKCRLRALIGSQLRSADSHRRPEAESTRVVDTYGNASANLLDLGYDADAAARSNQDWGKVKASNHLYYADAFGDGQALATSYGAGARAGDDNRAIAYRKGTTDWSTISHNDDLPRSQGLSYAAAKGNTAAALDRTTG